MTLADSVPTKVLVQLTEAVPKDEPHSATTRSRSPTPSRLERMRDYQPKGTHDTPQTNDVPPEKITEEQQPEATAVSKRMQLLEFAWLGQEPVEVEIVRYSQVIHVDRVHALSAPLSKIAKTIDRNPVNHQGFDKYEAITDHLANRIACGIMPWESSTSVKRMKSKALTDKGYPETVWYNFDLSPNAPRVYFTLGPERPVSGDPRPCRQLIILAETDKAHQIEVLRELTGRSVRTLRSQGAGAQ